MTPLIDADILRYEIGFAAQTGWRAITEGQSDVPPWDYVEQLLHMRIEQIKAAVNADQPPILYLSKGKSFRFDIARKRPYKGTRKENKPWHYDNLTAYMISLGAEVVENLEADDAMAIRMIAYPDDGIICSRDKDLRQVPGWFYSWELGRQPEFGPVRIDDPGTLSISDDGKKLSGTGLSFFYAQVLMGDVIDNIPGVPKLGPRGAHKLLADKSAEEMLQNVKLQYQRHYGTFWEEELTEQGRLAWVVRRLNPDGSPELWTIGQTQ